MIFRLSKPFLKVDFIPKKQNRISGNNVNNVPIKPKSPNKVRYQLTALPSLLYLPTEPLKPNGSFKNRVK